MPDAAAVREPIAAVTKAGGHHRRATARIHPACAGDQGCDYCPNLRCCGQWPIHSIRLADDAAIPAAGKPDDLTVVGSRRSIALPEGRLALQRVDVVMTAIGMPSNGAVSPAAHRLSAAAASASADSVSTTRKAFNVGWLTSIAPETSLKAAHEKRTKTRCA